jgi:hypothetical protein
MGISDNKQQRGSQHGRDKVILGFPTTQELGIRQNMGIDFPA